MDSEPRERKNKELTKAKEGASVSDSPAVSMERTKKADSIKSRKIAVLMDHGFNHKELETVMKMLKAQGAHPKIVSMFKGKLKSSDGREIEVDKSHITTASIMYDAVFVPGGKESVEALKKQGDALHFINEAFKHCKPIGALNEGVDLLMASNIKGVKLAEEGSYGSVSNEDGVVTVRDEKELDAFNQAFTEAIRQHRHWNREEKMQVPA